VAAFRFVRVRLGALVSVAALAVSEFLTACSSGGSPAAPISNPTAAPAPGIASLKIALSNPSPAAGTAATSAVTVTAFDANGKQIGGSASYNVPIELSVEDPERSGAVSLSTSSLLAPGSGATLKYDGRNVFSANVVAQAAGVKSVAATFAPKPVIVSLPLPRGASPGWIAAGPDGNLWFTDHGMNAVGKSTPAGAVTEFPLPTPNSQPQGIVAATDGRLWFAEFNNSAIGAITPSGRISEFPEGPSGAQTFPFLITDRTDDGDVWFSFQQPQAIGYQSLTVPANNGGGTTGGSGVYGIAAVPGGDIYFTESDSDDIGRSKLINPFEHLALAAGSTPEQMVLGSDGNLWFTENGTSKIGRVSPKSFTLTGEFATVTPNAGPVGIAVGKDGGLWFTERSVGRIGHVTLAGAVTEYAVPGENVSPGITAAADGTIWFCEFPGGTGKLGKISY
jgi:streptogramin lyase